MIDVDTFLLILYVMIDDFCKAHLPAEPARPGVAAALSRSELLTLALLAQWGHFASERAFYRYATHHLRPAFPTLPHRAQFNRQVRAAYPALVALGAYLTAQLQPQPAPYEPLDSAALPTRSAKRRGRGWLAGLADIGWSNRLGWYEGFHLLVAVTPQGVITGWGCGPASSSDQPLAESFFALRQQPVPGWQTVGRQPTRGQFYLTDKGFESRARHQQWAAQYQAYVVGPPQQRARWAWPGALRRWVAARRQIVETVFDKLQHTFRLGLDRPHEFSGVQARLAAQMALHNFCIWLNRQQSRPGLAFADLIAW